MKDVIISIKGIQTMGPELPVDSDSIELITGGQYQHSGDEMVLSYMESEMTGMEGTKTTFRISPDRVVLTREGAVESEMVFQQGRKHVFLYNTPFGATTMGVDTQKIRNKMHEDGGRMEINYTIDVDSMVVSQNSFVIHVRENATAIGMKQ